MSSFQWVVKYENEFLRSVPLSLNHLATEDPSHHALGENGLHLLR